MFKLLSDLLLSIGDQCTLSTRAGEQAFGAWELTKVSTDGVSLSGSQRGQAWPKEVNRGHAAPEPGPTQVGGELDWETYGGGVCLGP